MSRTVAAYAHIPGLRLGSMSNVALGGCCLVALPFGRWCALEDPAVTMNEERYHTVAPVFLQCDFEVDSGDLSEVEARLRVSIREASRRASYAVLLALWKPLPDPVRSAAYYELPGGHVIRSFGVNERELLLTDQSPYVTISPDSSPAIKVCFEKLTAVGCGEHTPELTRLIETMQMPSRPNHDLLDLVLHFVSVHEDIFNWQGERPYGETFARRLAAFFCSSFEQLPQWHAIFKALYNIRNDAIHGRDSSPELENLATRFQSLMLYLVFACSQTAGHLCSQMCASVDLSELARLLDEAHDSRDHFEAIRAKLNKDWFRS